MAESSPEDRVFEFNIAIVVLLATFKHIYGSSGIYSALLFTFAFVAVVLMAKGVVEIILKNQHSSFSSGGAIAITITLLFNGLPYLLRAAEAIVGLPLALFYAII